MSNKWKRVSNFYDSLGERRDYWVANNRYYYDAIEKLLTFIIPPGQRVLDIGSGNGDQLAAVRPSVGVGVDLSEEMVELASRKHPHLRFLRQAAEELQVPDDQVEGAGAFDFVTLVNVVGELADVIATIDRLRPLVRPQTRLVIVYYNHLWEPLIGPAVRLGWKMDSPTQNWLSLDDLRGFLGIGGWEVIKSGSRMPCPRYIPVLAPVINGIAGNLPVLQELGLIQFLVARPLLPLQKSSGKHTCSVVVPCKNEQDNIAALARRIPVMGELTEVIFVDDQSTDLTAERVREAMAATPDRAIKLVTGPGKGKGAAVRAGFDAATGDVLMILDADMTVLPEDLPMFFRVITENKGEFINGSRMVYPMEGQAMRLANIFGNKAFALLFSFLLGQRIKDTLCGTKVFMRSDYPKMLAARTYLESVDRWGDYDLLFGAAKNHLKIVELPVHYVERVAGEAKMTRRFENALVMLRMCWLALRKLKLA